jgi:Ulp1 family protease
MIFYTYRDVANNNYNLKVITDSKPIQENGYDCGVYTILFAKHFLSIVMSLSLHNLTSIEIESTLVRDINLSISQATATALRHDVHEELKKLAKAKKQMKQS